MGEARNRGTFNERKKQSIKKKGIESLSRNEALNIRPVQGGRNKKIASLLGASASLSSVSMIE